MKFQTKMAIIMITLAFFIVACNSNSGIDNSVSGKTELSSGTVEKIEIYHFHATRQCNSCKTVGAYAEETVNLFFSEQLKSGKIVFDHINIELPENAELVKKYGVTGASLWIGVYDSQGFHAEQNTDVWLKINNKDEYLLYLKSVINKKLEGDLS